MVHGQRRKPSEEFQMKADERIGREGGLGKETLFIVYMGIHSETLDVKPGSNGLLFFLNSR